MSEPVPSPSAPAEAPTREFVTFMLAGEEYGVEIQRVFEFIGYRALTRIPNVPPAVKGVLNLRGAVVPVVDLRQKFSLPAAEYDKYTVIIIVDVGGRTMGGIVDSVSDVVSLEADDIHATPPMSASIRTDFIAGMAEREDQFYILLDIDEVFDRSELEAGG